MYLQPPVGIWTDHLLKRDGAGIMFEMAAKFAEKTNAYVQQEGINVFECRASGMTLLIADYPHMPMSFEKVCPGWQAVFLGDE